MLQISDGVFALYLYSMGLQDWKKRRLSVRSLTVGSVLVALYRICIRQGDWKDYAMGIILAGLCGIICYSTRQALGYGDAWMMGIVGLYLGYEKMPLFLLLLSGICCGASMVLICKNHWKRRESFPLIPCFAIAYTGGWILWG